MAQLIFAVVVSYLLGGIPTSVIVGKVFRGIDIRQHGSGNAGATNAFRVLGWKLALPVVVVDILKGTVAVLFVSALAIGAVKAPEVVIRLACGIAAIAGHIWTPFAGFRGGKGVGTGFGVMIALAPLPLLLGAVVWIVLVLFTGYVSVGSIVGAISVPIWMLLVAELRGSSPDLIVLWTTVVVALGIVFTHRSNIRRLLEGRENRFRTPFVKLEVKQGGA